MSKQALQKIIAANNVWAGFRGEPALDINTLTTDQADVLYERIDMGLSPENLHCDGEISPSQARAKANTYFQAVKELKKRGFPVPADCWEIS